MDKFLNLGVAAHIRAASPGGPRYDATMSPEQRRSAENAIWLCNTCSKVIDDSPDAFTVDGLNAWKVNAEMTASRDSKVTADHVGSAIVELEALRLEILRFSSYWQSFDPANEWPSKSPFEEVSRNIIKHSQLRIAAYEEQLSPCISDALSLAMVILGPDSTEVKNLASVSEYARTNYLSMMECARALQKVKDVLTMR
ncbi:hypothetical protein [Streptomyces europaeiscabiei]|uniref:hypothetical protein n=1 Tax=Streptomyces europaeiscabiei TaxID=146819 RepID=UPI0029BA79FA|nr:hypothetical protein [Streptomyces europaeiscabiei]MDX3587677.1 hypothetical protein [Streptomyces europaeiscabiei]MDX3631850.1 hypothetical protein [Streptomyces europaeiscabiei]MDX3649631.1 hypothetical protein [Streptomyces europaeiscabiei]